MTSTQPELDPQIRAFAASSDRLFDAAYDALPLAEQRRLYNAWCAEWSGPKSNDIATSDLLVPTGDGPVPVRLYRRRDVAGAIPVILYIHGGGWILGNCDSHDQVTREMARQTGAAVLSVDYRLAPEHKFPAAFDDCYCVLSWLSASGAALGLDSARLAVAGDSAGGNLAAAVALAARDRGGPKISFQALIYPGLTFQRAAGTGSAPAEADSPGLTADSLGVYARAYLPSAADAANPYAAPLMARDFAGLPPAYVAAAWFDVIRPDSEIYVRALRAADVPAAYSCAAGLPHTYLRTIHFCAAAQQEFAALCQALKTALA